MLLFLNSDLSVELWEHIFVGDTWTRLIENCNVWFDSIVKGYKFFCYFTVFHRIVLENVQTYSGTIAVFGLSQAASNKY